MNRDSDIVIAGIGILLVASIVCCPGCEGNYPSSSNDIRQETLDMSKTDLEFQCVQCTGSDMTGECDSCQCIGGYCCCNYGDILGDMRK